MVISAINALTLSPALCARAAAAASRPEARASWAACCAASTGCATAMPASCARLVRVAVVSIVLLGAVHGRHRRRRQPHADRLPAGGGPGRLLRRGAACPRAPRSTARARSPSRSRTILQRIAASVQGTSSPSSASRCIDGVAQSNTAFLVARLKPFDERTARGDVGVNAADRAACFGAGQAVPDGQVFAFNLPPIIGLGTARRLRIPACRTSRAGRPARWRRRCAA